MMSTTVDRPLTIKAARALLSDVSRVSPERVREAEELIRDLHSRKPGYLQGGGTCVQLCQNCGHGTWSLHADGDDERWACDGCHREPMSSEEGRELRRARAEKAAAAAAEAAATAAAAPSLQETLAAAEAKLADTQAEFAKVENAAAIARDREAAAQAALNAAAEALSAARAKIAQDRAAALLDPSPAAAKPRTTVTETAAVAAAVAELEAATETVRLLEDRLADGRNRLHWAEYHRRNAARDVAYDERA